MKAPFPWFGGKRTVADIVWQRFGDIGVYAEPFAGSLAVLLGRPGGPDFGVETVNDLDGFVSNAWRAILHDPDSTVHHADWPVNENDLHARHSWLTEQRETLTRRLEGDPDYYDAKIAGWWLWGIACWIGGEFCSGKGPWKRVEVAPGDWQLVQLGSAGRGVQRRLVQLGSAGRGVKRTLVHLGDAGRGVKRERVHLGNAGRGNAGDGEQGLLEWLRALSVRLACVRVCSGDWKRIVTPSGLCAGVGGVRGIFLDPPYSAESGRDMNLYSDDSGSVAHEVRAWCLSAPTEYRIALCGYEGEYAMPDDWECYEWKTQGGMANQGDGDSKENRFRERIWFSPACIKPKPESQLSLI